MNSIFKGLQLPAFDVEMLGLGKIIAVPFKQSVPEGQAFWLYPTQRLPAGMSLANYYQAEFFEAAEKASDRSINIPLELNFWGVVDYQWSISRNQQHLLSSIARSTIWLPLALEKILADTGSLKLLFLRAYQLPDPLIVKELSPPGSYVFLSDTDTLPSDIGRSYSVISTSSFHKRKARLIAGEISPEQPLESLLLHLETVQILEGSKAQKLQQDLRSLLGWHSAQAQSPKSPSWIKTISALGERSVEEDKLKSSYQAGTDFENIVRQSLEFLGFTVDYSHRGGAGGLDLFCSAPYPLVGECKSGKKIPNDTAVQLLNLGTLRLENKTAFSQAVKLIIGPGEPTEQLGKAARVHGMSIIHPRTLEQLVTLHHQYPIDLWKLKDYLVDGQADDSVSRFIQESYTGIRLRAHLVQQVRKFLDQSNDPDADLSALYAAYTIDNPPQPLKREELQNLLIELSSPLVGYLGRRKGIDGSDRFYFLRPLTYTPPK